MDYTKFFSADVPSLMRSPVREIFSRVDLSAICSFAGGYPAAVTFPMAELPSLTARVLEKYGTKALQYGATQGAPELRAAIARPRRPPVFPLLSRRGRADRCTVGGGGHCPRGRLRFAPAPPTACGCGPLPLMWPGVATVPGGSALLCQVHLRHTGLQQSFGRNHDPC